MKIALVVKASNGTQERETRNMGYWSYPVPEFDWRHFVFKGKTAYATEMNDGFDIIFQEDAGPRFYKDIKKPLVYLAIDSTLSDDHLESRLERAKNADLILVEQDDLEKFAHLGVSVKRLNYCVNDSLFRDNYGLGKPIDVSFYCGSNEERGVIRNMLRTFCKKRGLVLGTGTLHPIQYAKAMASSKIVVNWPRVPTNRPHRVFDAMACGACLVSGPLPFMPDDKRVEGRDYVEVQTHKDIPDAIDSLLASSDWRQQIATNGKRLVTKYHTWVIRARQLKQILDEEL